MTEADTVARYPVAEEWASSLIHGTGVVLSLAALPMLALATRGGPRLVMLGACVYGASLLLLYVASTLYHALPSPRLRPVLRALDHASIFVLIAGTYTPFTLLTLRGAWGWSLFAFVWTLALVGAVFEFRGTAPRGLRVALYVALGWSGLVAIRPLVENLPAGGLWLLFGGGVCYTLGVPFYLWSKLPFNHALWHVFVLGGSVLQFLAVWWYVLPAA
ncbi:MAG: hemolysin III family protein [Lysobacterales bacterium]